MGLKNLKRGHRVSWGVWGICLAALSIALLHRLEPGAGPMEQPLSWYARGPYGWLWVVATCAAGGGVLGIANGVSRVFPEALYRRVMTGVGLGLLGIGAFPTDAWFPWERTPTRTGGLHVLSVGIVIVGITILTSRTAGALLRRERRPAESLLAAFGLAYLVCLVATVAMGVWSAHVARPVRYVGLSERILLFLASLWFVTLGLDSHAGENRRIL